MAAFKEIKAEEIWVAFGTGTNFRYIAIHEVCDLPQPKNVC